MGNVVNIQINNNCGCGCGDGTTTGAPPTTILPGDYTEIPVPGSIDAPPSGYVEAGTSISDRQCKAAIFLYSWIYSLADYLANTSLGNSIIHFFATINAPRWLLSVIGGVIVGVAASLATFGLDVTDLATGPVGTLVGYAVVSFLVRQLKTNPINIPSAKDAVSKLPDVQDKIICALSKASDPSAAYIELEKILDDQALNLTEYQINFIKACAAPELMTMLHYTAEWWPSFDTATLAGITANCCGGTVDGTPILPSGTEGCQTSRWMIDQLIATFNGTEQFYSDYILGKFGTNWNPLDDDTEEIETILQANQNYFPAKVLAKATNKLYFFKKLAAYVNLRTGYWNGYEWSDSSLTWNELASHLSVIYASLQTGLRAALDEQDVFDALFNPMDAWITTNVTEPSGEYMRDAIKNLISPTGLDTSFCNLMFYQDADLFNYAAADCADEQDPAEYGDHGCTGQTATAVYDLSAQQYNWVLTYSGNGSAAYVPGTGFKFTPAGNALQRMQFTQSVKHSVKRVRITFGGMSVLGHYQLNTSSDGQNFTTVSDILYPAAPSSVTADLCIDDKYIQVAVNATTATAFWVSKIEFLG